MGKTFRRTRTCRAHIRSWRGRKPNTRAWRTCVRSLMAKPDDAVLGFLPARDNGRNQRGRASADIESVPVWKRRLLDDHDRPPRQHTFRTWGRTDKETIEKAARREAAWKANAARERTSVAVVARLWGRSVQNYFPLAFRIRGVRRGTCRINLRNTIAEIANLFPAKNSAEPNEPVDPTAPLAAFAEA